MRNIYKDFKWFNFQSIRNPYFRRQCSVTYRKKYLSIAFLRRIYVFQIWREVKP